MLNTTKGAQMTRPEANLEEKYVQPGKTIEAKYLDAQQDAIIWEKRCAELNDKSVEKSRAIRELVRTATELRTYQLDLLTSLTVWRAATVLAFIAGVATKSLFPGA